MRALFLAILVAGFGCQSNRTTPRVATDSEVEVLASLLAQQYDGIGNAPLVVQDKFSISELEWSTSHDELTKSLLSEAQDEVPDDDFMRDFYVPSDLVRDFCAKNAQPQPIWLALQQRLNCVLLTQEESDSFFSHDRSVKPDGWDRFYAKYPKSPGIVTISRVGFNRRGDMAMAYVGAQEHWLLGGGRIHVLRKQRGKWVRTPATIGPVWVSAVPTAPFVAPSS